MRVFMRFSVLLIVLGVLAGCAPDTTLTARQAAAKLTRDLNDAGLNYYWTWRLPLGGGERIARIHLLDENLYCLTNMNRLIAIDAARGVLQWSQWVEVAEPGKVVFEPTHVKGVQITRTTPTRKEILQPKRIEGIKPFDTVVISTITNALLIDRKTGDEIRNIQFNFGDGASAGACSDGRLLIVPDSRGWYHAILLHEMIETWTLSVKGTVSSQPRYMQDKVIVASEDGFVQVASTFRSRQEVWTKRLAGPVTAPMAVTPNQLLVPCEDRCLYAFDPTTGQKLWEPFDCKRRLRDGPQISDISVFQYARGGKFYALDLVKGTERWSLNDARRVLAAMNNNVYLRDNLNRLVIVDEVLGKVQTKIKLPRADMLAANTKAPAIYGASGDGRLYCIRPIDAGHITTDMLRKKAGK